jgi:hypothetical protein
MDEYFEKYDSLTKTFVFNFGIGNGGIGDIMRGILYLLEICKRHDIRFYFNTNCPLFNYLRPRYQKICIPFHIALLISEPIVITNTSDIEHIEPNKFYLGTHELVYPDFFDITLYDRFQYTLSDLFYFSDEVKYNAGKYVKDEISYISIHVRLGDKHLETDKQFVICHQDERIFDEPKLFRLIETNAYKTIYFFCDNNSYKQKIKSLYNFVNTINYAIGHTSLTNVTPEETLNAVTDFYLLTKSEHIYSMTSSGFPLMASKYKNTPITQYRLHNF